MLLWFLLAPGAVIAAEPKRNIASMNLCSDQLLLLLVEKAHIASLSYLAADPELTPLAAAAAGIHLNHGQAEELLPLTPDLIITSQFSATLAANLLERLHYPVMRLGIASNAAEIYAQIEQVAQQTGSELQAQQLITSMQQDIATQVSQLREQLQNKVGVFFSSNGFSYGSATLQHDFLLSLGMRNAASHLTGPMQLSLEDLLAANPDFIFINPPAHADLLLAHPLLQHPALLAIKQQGKVLELPDSYFQCAGPQFVQAYHSLAAQL